MTSTTDDVQLFLKENLTNQDDLTLSNVRSLLESRRKEQTVSDKNFQALTEKAKAILSKSLEQTSTHQSSLEQLSTSLTEAEQKMTNFIQTHIGTESPQATLLTNLTNTENKLKILDDARSYIKTLLISSELSAQALDLIKTEPDKAVTPYIQLVKFEKHIEEQTKDEEQYKELSSYLKRAHVRLWEDLNEILTKNFKETLDTISWPTPIKPPYGPQLRSKLKDFEKAFRNLLILQKSSSSVYHRESIIRPISIMLEGLSLRFKYHFETSKPTNRADKPEWYLSHVKNVISTHIPFLMTTIQPIIEGCKYTKTSAKDQFIRGLLDDVVHKLQKTMPQLVNQPNWLSHAFHQVLQFDKELQDEFAYDGYTDISNVILGNPIWFNAWFNAEKLFAQSRYDDIMLDGQAFNIYAEDVFDANETDINNKQIKRTKSAVLLVNLLENITNAYKLIPDTKQKIKFFIAIQLNLLGQYQKRLTSAIDSFEALSLIRSVPVPGALPEAVTGVMTATETGGTVSVMNRLYRWWTSARSIVDVLKDWTEDDFFLDLQFEALQDSEGFQSVMNSMNPSESSNMIRIDRLPDQQSEGLFAEALTAYEQLIRRSEKIIINIVVKEWITEARQYSKKDSWWQTTELTPGVVEISNELYKPLQSLRVTCSYLYTVFPQVDFLSVYRQILKEIEDWYWKNIITKSQFSTSGILQLETDLKTGLWKVSQRWATRPENLTKKLKETIQLLTLPFSSDSEDSKIPCCDLLMKALADTNQAGFAQEILAKIGIETLNNGQIRDVLRRRNDMLYSWN